MFNNILDLHLTHYIIVFFMHMHVPSIFSPHFLLMIKFLLGLSLFFAAVSPKEKPYFLELPVFQRFSFVFIVYHDQFPQKKGMKIYN